MIVVSALVRFSPVAAQEVEPPDSADVPLESTLLDSVPVDTIPAAPADTVVYNLQMELSKFSPVSDSVDFERHLTQNPTVALFKSMVIPGWGQIGNRKYFKAALFAGVDAWLIAEAIHYKRQASGLWDTYQAATDVPTRNAIYDAYSAKRSSRNKYTWFAVIVSFVSMFDAYVDAHLSGFPTRKEEKRFGVDVSPDLKGGVRASVSVPF